MATPLQSDNVTVKDVGERFYKNNAWAALAVANQVPKSVFIKQLLADNEHLVRQAAAMASVTNTIAQTQKMILESQSVTMKTLIKTAQTEINELQS